MRQLGPSPFPIRVDDLSGGKGIDGAIEAFSLAPWHTLEAADRLAATGDYDKAEEAFIARQPMGRFGQAEEIAALAVYLASDESGFVTGQAVNIDGGWTG